jgi:imidazoleglycerol-phosphate dehydratase/histidinol-phosphatase
VTNQDGLGTDSFPKILLAYAKFYFKGFRKWRYSFDDIFVDRSFPEDNAPTRKPRTGMLMKYIDNPAYDLANSFVLETV